MNNYFLVAAGGACGALGRYLVVTVASSWGVTFPLGTLVVNVAGSFAIGVFSAWIVAGGGEYSSARALFQTGFLGAFTTFSAFSLDTLNLFASGQALAAAFNVTLNVLLCLSAVAAGFALGGALRSALA